METWGRQPCAALLPQCHSRKSYRPIPSPFLSTFDQLSTTAQVPYPCTLYTTVDTLHLYYPTTYTSLLLTLLYPFSSIVRRHSTRIIKNQKSLKLKPEKGFKKTTSGTITSSPPCRLSSASIQSISSSVENIETQTTHRAAGA